MARKVIANILVIAMVITMLPTFALTAGAANDTDGPTVNDVFTSSLIFSSGADSVPIMLVGENLTDGIFVTAILESEDDDILLGPVRTAGSSTEQTAHLAFPPNTTTENMNYTIWWSFDGETYITNGTGIGVATYAITGITANPTRLPSSGGTTTITIEGVGLTNVDLRVFPQLRDSSNDEISDEDYEAMIREVREKSQRTTGTATRRTATLSLPANTSTVADNVYDIAFFIDYGENGYSMFWFAGHSIDTITVARVSGGGGGGGSSSGGGGSAAPSNNTTHTTQKDGTEIDTTVTTAANGTKTETVKATLEDSNNEITVEAVTTKNGDVTVTAEVKAVDVSATLRNGTSRIDVDVTDDIAKARELARAKGARNVQVDVTLSDAPLLRRVNNDSVKNLRVDVIGGYSNSVGSVKINKAVIDAASEAGKDMTIFVSNNSGRQRARVQVPATGKKLDRDLDVSVGISLGSSGNFDSGIEVSLSDTRKPAGTTMEVNLRGFLNPNSGIRAGDKVYVYGVNAKGETKLLGSTTISNNGLLTFQNGGRGDYLFSKDRI